MVLMFLSSKAYDQALVIPCDGGTSAYNELAWLGLEMEVIGRRELVT
jgi:hypothetical protein